MLVNYCHTRYFICVFFSRVHFTASKKSIDIIKYYFHFRIDGITFNLSLLYIYIYEIKRWIWHSVFIIIQNYDVINWFSLAFHGVMTYCLLYGWHKIVIKTKRFIELMNPIYLLSIYILTPCSLSFFMRYMLLMWCQKLVI